MSESACKTSRAVEMASELPEELLVEVLLRLPVKSLVRFRCVSKHWLNLIKSPKFIRMHLDRTDRDEVIVVKHRPGKKTLLSLLSYESLSLTEPNLETPSFDVKFDDANACINLVGSSNGLVCITPDRKALFLCNPALREFKKLPDRPFGCPDDREWNIRGLGFGYDSMNDDHKIVSIVGFEGIEVIDNEFEIQVLRECKAEIYYVNTGCWREVDASVPHVDANFHCGELFFNGACHWVSNQSDQLVDIRCIVTFDLTAEVFSTVAIPDECLDITGKLDSLLVLGQSLALIRYAVVMELEPEYIEIWVMKDYGVKESWVRQYMVGPVHSWRPLSFWKDNLLLFQGREGELISCPLGNGKTKDYPICGFWRSMEIIVYNESLVSVG